MFDVVFALLDLKGKTNKHRHTTIILRTMAAIKLKSRLPIGRTTLRSRWKSVVTIAGAAAIFLLFFAGGHKSKKGKSSSQTNEESTTPVSSVRLRSGLNMPSIGYGTCCRPSAKGEAIYKSTGIFLKHGGRLIDTAMAYGNHVEIGRAVKDSGISRSEMWITSKVSPNKAKSYDECLLAVDGILQELGTSYLDLVLIHTPKLGKELTIELWKGLIEAKRQGKTKAIGVSNFNQGEIEDIAKATGGELPEANEIQQHPWSSQAWKDLARWQKDNGIATIAYTSLGGGRFHRTGNSGGSAWPRKVTELAQKYGATESQVLLRWALQKDIAVIPGSGNEEHIKENLIIPFFELSAKDISDIEGAEAPMAWFDPKRGPRKYGDEEAAKPWQKKKKN